MKKVLIGFGSKTYEQIHKYVYRSNLSESCHEHLETIKQWPTHCYFEKFLIETCVKAQPRYV